MPQGHTVVINRAAALHCCSLADACLFAHICLWHHRRAVLPPLDLLSQPVAPESTVLSQPSQRHHRNRVDVSIGTTATGSTVLPQPSRRCSRNRVDVSKPTLAPTTVDAQVEDNE